MVNTVTYSCGSKCGIQDGNEGNVSMIECSACKTWFHYMCMGMPDLHKASLKFIESLDYTCYLCLSGLVAKEAKITALQKELDLMKKEVTTPKNLSVDVADTVSDRDQDSSESTNSGSEMVKVNGKIFQEVRPKTKNRICRYLQAGKCKFGRGGSGCNFSHPQTCKSFLNQTCNGNCRLLHPKLCHGSIKERQCFKPECKFYHLPHTKRNIHHSQPQHSFVGRNRFYPLESNYNFRYGRESVNRPMNSFLGQRFPSTGPDPMQYMLNLEGKVNQLVEMVQNLPQNPMYSQQNLNQSPLQTHLNQQEPQSLHQQGFWNNPAPPVQHH